MSIEKLYEVALRELDSTPDEQGVNTKDPRLAYTIAKAKSKNHGIAGDDMSALLMALDQENDVQDNELDSLDVYNKDQDVDINSNDSVNSKQTDTINDILQRLANLENR